jgi:hypothetical protein
VAADRRPGVAASVLIVLIIRKISEWQAVPRV